NPRDVKTPDHRAPGIATVTHGAICQGSAPAAEGAMLDAALAIRDLRIAETAASTSVTTVPVVDISGVGHHGSARKRVAGVERSAREAKHERDDEGQLPIPSDSRHEALPHTAP